MALSRLSDWQRTLQVAAARTSGSAKRVTQNRTNLPSGGVRSLVSSSRIYKASFSSTYTSSKPSRVSFKTYFTSSRAQNSGFNENPFENDAAGYQSAVTLTMKEMQEKFEELEVLDLPGYEVNEKDGVCELKLGDLGTYVINKQAPNKQIWWSSPLSGPKRYNYDINTKAWRNSRDGHFMYDLLNQEITSLIGQEFDMYTVAARPNVQ